MDEQNKLSFFFLGLGIGVAVGILFAPKSGEDTRRFLRTKADESTDYLKKKSGELRDNTTDILDKGKQAVARQREQLQAAVEAGKQAYRDATGKTEADLANEGV